MIRKAFSNDPDDLFQALIARARNWVYSCASLSWRNGLEIDFETLSLKELREIRARVERAIATFDERRKRDVVSKIEELVREHGFAISDISEVLSNRKRANSVAKYANPANPEQTWTGRGRQPNWIKDALAAGKSLKDLAI